MLYVCFYKNIHAVKTKPTARQSQESGKKQKGSPSKVAEGKTKSKSKIPAKSKKETPKSPQQLPLVDSMSSVSGPHNLVLFQNPRIVFF
jgi:hypothetical protein